jgi:MAternally-affected-uncoordination protein
MSAADGLLALAEEAERRRDFSTAATCLESALGPAHAASPLLPLAEARARLRLAGLLLARSRGLASAKAHLERALLVLNPLPSAPPRLKLLAHSLLATVYGLLGAIPSQKHVLRRGLGLLASASASGLLPAGPSLLWTSNLQAQLASALAVDGDAASALSALSEGAAAASELDSPQLDLFFAATTLHVHLLCWEDTTAVEAAVARVSELWDALTAEEVNSLFFISFLSCTKIVIFLHVCLLCRFPCRRTTGLGSSSTRSCCRPSTC